MQLFSRKTAILALSLGALSALGACGDDVTVTKAPDAPVVVSITPPSATMNIGESVSFAVQITGGAGTATLASCASSNASVATAAASSGKCNVTAVASGNVTVTATASTGGIAAASVTVNAAQAAISNLQVSPTVASVPVNQSVTIVPAVTKAASAVAVTYSYASSSASIATVNGTTGVVTAVAPGVATITVTAAGSATGYTTTTLTSASTITVTALPTGLTAMNVQPTTLALALGATSQLVANTTVANGASAATLSYTSSNSTVATVSAAGLVTAAAPGSAVITVTATSAANSNFAAATISAAVPVTVAPPANLTIASVTQGPTLSSAGSFSSINAFVAAAVSNNNGIVFSANAQVNQPVDIANTRDQIQVNLNLEPNGQAISSVRVYICDNAGANCGNPAAEQTFGGSQANSSAIQLSINTADFTANFTSGTASVLYANGQHVIKASVRTVAGTETFNATNNQSILNFNNIDGWAAQFVAPAATATRTVSGVSFNYFGGPGANGTGTIRPVAVFYTPARTVQSASIGMTTCGTPRQYTATPYTTTFSNATALTATNLSCGGYEQGQSDAASLPTVTAAQDNSNNSAPTVTTGNGYRTSVSVAAPVAIRLDYNGPSFTAQAPASGWASGALNNFSWRTAGSNATGNGIASAPTDAGVGPAALSTYTFAYTGCTTGNGGTSVNMPTATVQDVPQCTTDFTAAVYTVTGTGADVLGNTRTSTTGLFGVDNVAPFIRYTVGGGSPTPGAGNGSAADTTTYSASALAGTGFAVTAVPVAGDSIFATDALDDRSGLTTASNILARANQVNSTGTCQRGTGTPGAAFITAPTCGFVGLVNLFSFANVAAVDGYRRTLQQVYGSDFGIGGSVVEGYYTYQAKAQDRAGNVGTTAARKVLFNTSTPAMTGLGIPSTVTAAGPNVFTPNFTELVEAWVTNLAIGYGTGNALLDPAGTTRADLLYPATLYNARFNDAIGLNGNFTTGTPFTSGVNMYTNIEYAAAGGGSVNGAAVSRPDSTYARVINAGGNVSSGNAGAGGFFGVQLLSGNVATDATSWNTFNANVLTWGLGTVAAQWNAPANGVKAIVTATSQQINSPFTRVDYYEYQIAAPTVIGAAVGQWVYIGTVDATATPCSDPAQTCGVYIADNGVTRVWTYRLTTRTNGVNGLAAGTVLTGLTAAGTNRFMAIASNGTKGRVLATNPAAPASQMQ